MKSNWPPQVTYIQYTKEFWRLGLGELGRFLHTGGSMTCIIGIIATKNRNELLKTALDSALNQSRKLDELIVVSDSDGDCFYKDKNLCEEKCIFLKDRYTRNYAGNLNTAIDNIVLRHLIHNEEDPDDIYIAFLDDDDSWKPNYIESCYSKLLGKPDFVVAGLNYFSEGKEFPLTVPKELSKSSFLAKNPHIQGSNTFIKLSTLLKAGCFDEALDSTTDRDFFTRVLMLNPKYETIDKILVDVDAHNDRPRLTNSNDGKKKSLSYFYSKYYGLMNEEEKLQFFSRAQRYTELNKKNIDENLPKEKESSINNFKGGFNGHVTFGFIASNEELGLRFLNGISKLKDIDSSIVLLCNISNPSEGFIHKAKEIKASLVTLKEAKTIGLSIDCLEFAYDSLQKNGHIKDIAVARTILHELLKKHTKDGDVIWILDDDMEFKYYTRENSKFCLQDLDVKSILSRYRGNHDIVIGSYSGDAPLPTLSTLRTSLLDFTYKAALNKSDHYRTDIYDNRDYYYDLSENHIGLETPLSSEASSIDDVFSGKATSRKLFVKNISEFDPYCRGGNTIIFNRDALNIPNIAARFGDKIARRGDYFWVEQAKKSGFKVIGSSFATLHSKAKTDFVLEKEADKLLKDLLGSSFTKTIESNVDETRESFYQTFKTIYEDRLTRIVDSFYRIVGLLKILDKDSYKGFETNFIKRFTKKAKYYLYEPMVRASYDVIRNTITKHEYKKKKDEISSLFGDEYSNLGYGQEGAVLSRNDSCIYKVFYNEQDFSFLQKASKFFFKCEQLEELSFETINGYQIIAYSQKGNIKKYNGGHIRELILLLRFLKEEDLVISNIKKGNFILLNNKLKFIDYGKNIVPLNESNLNRETKRAFEMVKYPNLPENEFAELIEMDYMNEDKDVLFGLDIFKKLIGKREKEAIHDGIIIKKIRSYSPKTILDYGAGKCKIMNQLKDEADCYVFDVDLKTMHSRASNGVNIIDKIEEFDKKVDLAVSNLVLCNVTEEWDNKILNNISKILKKDGHAIISICDPFFDYIDNTELRSGGYKGKYEDNCFYTKTGLYGPKNDYHRPFSYYENLFKKHGFEISETIESDGANIDTLNSIGEHLIFDLTNKGLNKLSDITLMIKVCPMDYEIVIPCVRQIVNNLENGCVFAKKIVSVDLSETERNRRYSGDNKSKLLNSLEYLKSNGTIDEMIIDENHDSYIKWFGSDSIYPHCENGQQLLATLNGFDNVKTRYVFQTDIDILYKTEPGSFQKAFKRFKESKAITGTIGICRNESLSSTFGNRTEVRTCFLDLEAINRKLPLANSINDVGQFVLPWHRALDKTLVKEESVRFADNDIYFVHIQNTMKKDNFISTYLLGNIPANQKDKVDAVSDIKSWYPKSNRTISIFSRGRNVSVEKLKRLIDSLKSQVDQDFDFVYFDDCSEIREQEYLYCLSNYDPWCKKHMILIENARPVDSLANFELAMKYIITKPDSIVVNIDGDDALMDSNGISIIRNAYKNGADMTSGGCFRADKPTKRYSIDSFGKSWERNGDNIWLHPKTFRRYLFDYVGDFLKDGNQYVDVHTDYAMLLPIVEAAKHPVEIKERIYYFEPSINNQNHTNKYLTEHRDNVLKKLLNKAKRRFMKPVISVIGDAVIDESDEEYTLAKEIGKALVDSGFRVQTGGLGGVMEAVLKGGKESSKYEFGDTIGILPGNDTSEANDYADIKIATGLDNMRARQVVDAYAVIAIGGGAGTLAEIATAWSMYKLIIAWNGKGWSSKLADQRIDDRERYKELLDDRVYSFSDVEEAINLIKRLGNRYQKEYHGIKWRKK